MLDLTNYDVDIKKPLTRAEFDERVEKGLIKSGETVEVYDNYRHIVRTKLVIIPPPEIKVKTKTKF